MRALAAANRALAELKGRAATIPNQGILIDTLALQEAKACSEIENIVTTQDELFHLYMRVAPASASALELAAYGAPIATVVPSEDRLTLNPLNSLMANPSICLSMMAHDELFHL